MDSDRTPQQQEQRRSKKQQCADFLTTMWKRAKEQCKSYAHRAYSYGKEWLKRPWWFHEKDPVAKFTGWVAVYTGILVVVSALQFFTLQNTDRTTREALIAANRAWVGPTTVTISALQKDKGVDIKLQYQNTGRQPAFEVFTANAAITYSAKEWDDGTAVKKIIENANSCFSIKKLGERTQVAYPSGGGFGGSGYSLEFNTDNSNRRPRIVVTDDLISGQQILVVQWCWSYLSINEIHHSTSCNFYQTGVTTTPTMNICTVGNDAD